MHAVAALPYVCIDILKRVLLVENLPAAHDDHLRMLFDRLPWSTCPTSSGFSMSSFLEMYFFKCCTVSTGSAIEVKYGSICLCTYCCPGLNIVCRRWLGAEQGLIMIVRHNMILFAVIQGEVEAYHSVERFLGFSCRLGLLLWRQRLRGNNSKALTLAAFFARFSRGFGEESRAFASMSTIRHAMDVPSASGRYLKEGASD